MKLKNLTLIAAAVLAVSVLSVPAQKSDKKWTEWSKKDADKILSDSPWAQTQTDSDTSQMFYSPTSDPNLGARRTETTGSRTAEGATNQTVNVVFKVRIFSARPIRQALARLTELAQESNPAYKDAKPEQKQQFQERLRNFAEVKAPDSIIVTVVYESNDQRAGNSVMQAFNSAVTATLKNNTYLERNDGKHLSLEEYIPPGRDGFGARFIFLRNPDGKPFFADKNDEIHFVAQFPNSGKIDRRFKIASMLYEGEVEF